MFDFSSRSNTKDKHSLFLFGLSEAMFSEISLGSMGMVISGKYTDDFLYFASKSKMESLAITVEAAAMCIHIRLPFSSKEKASSLSRVLSSSIV